MFNVKASKQVEQLSGLKNLILIYLKSISCHDELTVLLTLSAGQCYKTLITHIFPKEEK